jgi:hypothetical protein
MTVVGLSMAILLMSWTGGLAVTRLMVEPTIDVFIMVFFTMFLTPLLVWGFPGRMTSLVDNLSSKTPYFAFNGRPNSGIVYSVLLFFTLLLIFFLGTIISNLWHGIPAMWQWLLTGRLTSINSFIPTHMGPVVLSLLLSSSMIFRLSKTYRNLFTHDNETRFSAESPSSNHVPD